MGVRGEGSGGQGGGKWGKRGREVGVRGEGSGECLPPCPPPLYTCVYFTRSIYYGLGFAYRMLKTQKQNTLLGNESFEDCSISH